MIIKKTKRKIHIKPSSIPTMISVKDNKLKELKEPKEFKITIYGQLLDGFDPIRI